MVKKIINIPDLGEAEDVEVIEIYAKKGDLVASEDPIIVLESDKAAMEIPASTNGKVVSIEVSVGDIVSSGSPFLQIETKDNELKVIEEDVSEDEPENTQIVSEKKVDISSTQLTHKKNLQSIPKASNPNVYAGPAVRKLAREFGIDLLLVSPSGPKGRIQKEDLHLYVKSKLSAELNESFQFSQPDIDYSKWGSITEKKLSKFQKSALSNLHTSWINIPHVTQHDECDLTTLLDEIGRAHV